MRKAAEPPHFAGGGGKATEGPRSLTGRAARSPSEGRRRRCGGGLWGGAGLTGPTPAFGRGFVGAVVC